MKLILKYLVEKSSSKHKGEPCSPFFLVINNILRVVVIEYSFYPQLKLLLNFV